MSCWTQIRAHIEVDFGHQTEFWIHQFFADIKDKEYSYACDLSKKGPGCEITGSEGNAIIVYEALRNHVMDHRDRQWQGNIWSITISGDLRDREFKDTVAEWQRFAWKLAWYVHHECKKVSVMKNKMTIDHGLEYEIPNIRYFNVDILGEENEWYHRSSIKKNSNSLKGVLDV